MKLLLLCLLLLPVVYACREVSNVTALDSRTQASPTPAPQPRADEIVKPDIPKAVWERIFFEAIEELSHSIGEGKLREKKIADTDLELRIWGGFGITTMQGFLLNRSRDRWSAKWINEHSRAERADVVALAEPSDGWEGTWRKLLDKRLLSLPDAQSIKCNPMIDDGFSYVVEIKKGANYRTYMYENPDSKLVCREASDLLEIIRIVANEYGAKGMSPFEGNRKR